MTPAEFWEAGRAEREAKNAQHKVEMADPEYAARHYAGIVEKIKREGPSSGRISRRHAVEFEAPMGPPALKTSEQLINEELKRREAKEKKT